MLEKEAVLAMKHKISPIKLSVAIRQEEKGIDINVKPLLEKLCRLREKEDVRALALGFHYAIAEMILSVCELLRSKYHIYEVVLSGGVFVNTVLTEEALRLLRERDFIFYRNMAVPAGDGGISLGQAYLGQGWLRNIERRS